VAPRKHLLFARLAHRRVIDLAVDRTVGIEDPLSSACGLYGRLRAARRIRVPAFVRRDVIRLGSGLPFCSPISGTAPSSTVATSGGIRR
jgi:hypothetical protein